MEPITFTAIVAALSAGVAAGVGNVGESALVDAYQGLKAALKLRFGDNSEVVEAVDMLEKRPDSVGRKGMLKEELERARVDEDPDVKQAAQELLDRLNAQPGGGQHIQSAIGTYSQFAQGSYIAQATEGSTAIIVSYDYAPPRPVDAATLEAARRRLAELRLEEVPKNPAALPPGSRMDLKPNRFFVGRQERLKDLAKILSGGDDATSEGQVVAVVVSGMGGVGNWLHHCNIDRLWAEWNAPPHSHQNTSDALWTDFRLAPFDRVVGDLQDITQLGYTYDTLAQPQPAQPSPLPPLRERARERFELMEPQVASLEQSVSFPVETPQSALPLVAEAIAEEDVAEDGGPSVLAIVRDVEPPQDLRVTVNVFLNCPYLSAETPVSDPHYVGSFAFFGVHGDHGGHDTHSKSFALDLTDTVDRLRALEPGLESRLTVQLMPVPLEGRDVQPEEIRIGGVEIVYT